MRSTLQHDDGSSLSRDSSESENELHVPSFKFFSLSSVDLRDDTEQLSTQLDEFRTAPFSTCKSRFPPIIPLLQHFEVFLSSTEIKKVAQIVSSYYKKQKRNHCIQEYVDDTRNLYSSLRQLIGALAFDRVSRHIRSGETTMALGLAPSLTLRSMNCPLCRARKCLHLFCPECGKIFDAKTEVCKEFGIQSADGSIFGKSSAIPQKTIKKHGRDIRNRNGVENDEGIRTVVITKRSLNLQIRCDKAAIHGRMCRIIRYYRDQMNHYGKGSRELIILLTELLQILIMNR